MMVGKQWVKRSRDEACTDERVREASSNNGYEAEGKAF